MDKLPRLLKAMLIIAGCSIPWNQSTAQEGNPFISNYITHKILDKQIFDISQNGYCVMQFATRQGILIFDSENWQLVNTPDIALSLFHDTLSNKTYVGCINDFGLLERSRDGVYEYKSLSGMSYAGEVTEIIRNKEEIIFFSSGRITRTKINDDQNVFCIDTESGEYFSGIFRHQNRIFINSNINGLYEMTDKILLKFPGDPGFVDQSILFHFPFDKDEVLIGTDKNNLYLFNGSTFRMYEMSDREYLDESELAGGVSIDNRYFALATILGGCLILDKTTGESKHIINYQNGLPDDEIYAIGIDRNRGIWLSHEYGLSRIDLYLPVKNYHTFPGLEGNVESIAYLDEILYVGTNEGIYYLGEKKDYLEEEIVIRVVEEIPPEEDTEAKEDETGEQMEEDKQEQLSKRELRKLRREEIKEARQQDRKNVEVEKQEEKKERPILQAITDKLEQPFRKKRELPRTQTTYKKQKIYSLQSISHEFIRLSGFDGKCNQLVIAGNRILAGTHDGLYEIVNNRLKPVFPDWYIVFIQPSVKENEVFVGTGEKVYLVGFENGTWSVRRQYDEILEEVFSVFQVSENETWFGCDNATCRLRSGQDTFGITPFVFSDHTYDPVYINGIRDELYFYQSSGISILRGDSIIQFSEIPMTSEIPAYFFSPGGITWIKSGENWYSLQDDLAYNGSMTPFLNLFNEIKNFNLDKDGNLWVLHENKLISKVLAGEISRFSQSSYLHMTYIKDSDGHLYNLSNAIVEYANRSLEFDYTIPCYLKSSSSKYKYYIEGLTEDWSGWSYSSTLNLPHIPPGKYIIRYKAQSVLGNVSDEQALQFQIKPPFWLSIWFILLSFIVLIMIVLGIVRLRTRKLQHDNRILEEKVKQRTAEIERQKNEIEDQKQEIMDSIHYAQRIQKAVLPSEQIIKKALPENFILFLPRDIVSGDFYWMTQQDEWSIFAAADCTGHGVPGAFMSMLGVSFLNEIISKQGKLIASEILTHLRELIMTTLSQKESESKDGMDIALCILNNKTKELQYSGAFNPLFMIRHGELTEFKADRMPIGIYGGMETDFTNHEIKVKKGDCLYIFSDGFADQIGGERGKKYMSKKFKELLVEIHAMPMKEQHQVLHERIEGWMGDYQQVDDILLIGIRI
jgi:serine phosphatase RsbU (regulator of sigma subunit)